MKKKLILSLMALSITSCSLAPQYQTPPLPMANSYPTSTAPITHIAWHHYFTDPYLQQLIQLALANNRDLRTAILRVQEAQAAFNIERSQELPNINAHAQLLRHQLPNMEATTTYQVGLGMLAWELDFWGRIRNLKSAALENFLATEATQHAVTISLITQVADNYHTLLELHERSLLAQQTIDSRQRSFAIFTHRVAVGASSQSELAQTETLLTQAQLLGSQLKHAKANQLHALNLLVGTELPPLPRDLRLDARVKFPELQAGLPSDLLTARPDIIAAEHRLKAAGANIGAARAAFFPRITLTGLLGSASPELHNLLGADNSSWLFVPSLSLPILDGGNNRAHLKLATIRKHLAIAAYEKTIQVAFREVSDALNARQSLATQLAIQQRMLAAEHKRARLAKLRYDHGAAPYLEVLDAQRELLTAEQQLVQTRRALLASYIHLYAALGGTHIIATKG